MGDEPGNGWASKLKWRLFFDSWDEYIWRCKDYRRKQRQKQISNLFHNRRFGYGNAILERAAIR